MPENAYRRRHLHDQLARSAPPCPEREDLDQTTPAGLLPAQKMCTRCGRVTARRDAAGMPWCGGDPITADGVAGEIAPGRFIRPTGPLAVAA